MNPERWRRVRQLFERAVELAATQRAEFLEAACGSDEELRREVEDLLAHEAEAPPEFATPPPERPEFAPARALPDGTNLGGFTLLEAIGRGASGVVYRARQESLGRDVAIKVFAPNLLTTEAELVRFRQEVRTAGRMEHPGIARVLDHGQRGELLWYAMELVPGHGLDEELRRQRIAPLGAGPKPFLPRPGHPDHASTAAQLVAGVADALEHAHRAGVIHRDVKPSNLVLTPQGSLKLVDFGIAKSTAFGQVTSQQALTASHQLIGSVPYMSPEQARVLKLKVDQRTDIYSLGVVLYELLTLRRPFEGETTAEVLTQLRSTEPRPVRRWNPRAPTDLAVICARAMAKDPNERYPSAAAFRDDLQRFLRHEAIFARPPSVWRRLRRQLRRRRVWWIAGLAAGTALLVGWQLRRALVDEHLPARLTVSGPAGAAVLWRPMDPRTGLPGRERSLGRIPLRDVAVPAGYGRLEVLTASGRRGFARVLHEGLSERVEVPTPGIPGPWQAGMVRFEGGSLEVDGPEASPLFGLTVQIEPFWIDETEVSIGDYRRFLVDRPEQDPPLALVYVPNDGSYDERPVVGVSWADALAYAEWRGKRLPTHGEWLFATRGEALRPYPWGGAGPWRGATQGPIWQPGDNQENLAQFLEHTLGVRASGADRTPEGLLHALGNVFEWTESAFCDLELLPLHLDINRRIVCGGAWDAQARGSDLGQLQHWGISETERHWTRGFRCAAGD